MISGWPNLMGCAQEPEPLSRSFWMAFEAALSSLEERLGKTLMLLILSERRVFVEPDVEAGVEASAESLSRTKG